MAAIGTAYAHYIPSHDDLDTQALYISRIERRCVFLQARIAGTTAKHQISKNNYEQRKKFEELELASLLWAVQQLRIVLESHRRLFAYFEKRFKEREISKEEYYPK